MVAYKIYGMHSRDAMINNLKNQLGIADSDVYYDDRPNGGLAIYTAKKAWLSPIGVDETHRCVFPDDIEVCDDFTNVCEKITSIHPNAIISLFCWEGRYRSKFLDNLSSPYVRSRFVIGMGIIMPVEYIQPCFDWITETYDDIVPDDAAIRYWAEMNGIPVITTIPSLVQHLGDDSILTPNAPVRKSVYFAKDVSSVDWMNPDVITIRNESFTPCGRGTLVVHGQ